MRLSVQVAIQNRSIEASTGSVRSSHIFFTVDFVKMAESRDLIEKVSPEPIGQKGDKYSFLLENQVETHRMPGRNDIDNQMVPMPA